MMSLGEQLIRLCEGGQQEVLLVAPFMKRTVLEKLFKAIHSDVVVHCITRWRPEEIAQGVSDLEVWHVVQNRPNTVLWLHNNLHAKYYRVDNQCLIGSANLTHTALGWVQNPNYELLIKLPAGLAELVRFENDLWTSCFRVTEEFVQQMLQLVALIKTEYKPLFTSLPEQDSLGTIMLTNYKDDWWIPTLRHPEELYRVYHGNHESLTITTLHEAHKELQIFAIPLGLSESAFKQYCGIILLQQPIVRKIDILLISPQRFGAVRQFLRSLPCAEQPNFDATYVWQTLIRWLFYFLPERYIQLPSRHSEVIQRKMIS